jgi:uncharacterized protein YneF (UPF0154 family)
MEKPGKIQGGYILLSRKLIENKIMSKPPLYLKVWVWILLKAQHKGFKNLKRGQLWTSIPEIREAMAYNVGFRKVKPSYKEIRQVLDFLRNPNEGQDKGTMIGTMKGTHGMLINVDKYEYYQDYKNYEGHNERPREIPTKDFEGHNINNEWIMNEQINNIYAFWNSQKIIQHQELKDALRSTIKARIEAGYTQEQICEAISNYKTVLTEDKYYWTHKWTLQEFLLRGLDKFLTKNEPFKNYLAENKERKSQKPNKNKKAENYGW